MNLYLLHNDPSQLPLYGELFHLMNKHGDIVYVNEKGKRHKDNDLPAAIWPDGSQFWYVNGLLHRDNDLPAIIWASGTQEWHKNGLRHRDNDLPAVIYADGSQEWYVNGVKIK